MTSSAFERLYGVVKDPERLQAVYADVLGDLFRNSLWEGGPAAHRRVLWSQGRRARTADPETFGSPGLYLWGIEERPIYLGMTRNSFNRRFSRYIWRKQSQCNLALAYEAALISKGIAGFPVSVIEEYAKHYGGTKVRLRGAVRFAEEGIDKIWFALFPHDKMQEIRSLEKELIPIAGEWNKLHCPGSLLNIESAHL